MRTALLAGDDAGAIRGKRDSPVGSERTVFILSLVFVVVPSLVAFYVLASTWRGLLRLRRLADVAGHLERWPRVSVISPACNEERHVEHALASILSVDYPDLAVVAIDDRSTDRTGEILDSLARRDPRLVVHHVHELQAGWLGKVHALARGVEHADGEWLLFVDADVHLAPRALRAAIADAERRGLDLLTVVPTIDSAGRLSGAIFGLSLAMLSVGGRLLAVSDPGSPAVAATGAFILVRREALERSAGLEWLKLEVADDFGLCLLIKSHGGHCDIVNGGASVKLEWYASFREMQTAMQKNLFAILGRFSQLRMLALACAFAWLGLLPIALIVDLPGPLRTLVLMGEAALMASVALASRATGRRRSGAWLAPLACLGMSWMVLRAAFVGWRVGGIVWRGVLYPTELLAASQRVRV